MAKRLYELAGASIGVLLWAACAARLDHVHVAVPFYLTSLALIFGIGAAMLVQFEPDVPIAERTAIACAIGLAVAPMIACVMAVCGVLIVFAPAAFALSGWMAGRWYAGRRTAPPARQDRLWYAVLPLAGFAVSTWVSAARMTTNGDQTWLYGDYDTFDLTYFTGIAISLTHPHAIPPPSPFYSGHRIIYQYLPLMLLAQIHNVSGAGLLETVVRWGWPMFGSVAAGAVFALCRRLGSVPFAVSATVLMFVGSSLGYFWAWYLPHSVRADPMIWSSVVSAPSAEWLYFNAWTPALAVIAAGLYATTRIDESRRVPWSVLAGLCFGCVFLIKSFAYLVLVPALSLAAVILFLRRHPSAGRMAWTAAGSVLFALPWMLVVLPYNRPDNRGATLSLKWLPLVEKTMTKIELAGPIDEIALRVVANDHGLITGLLGVTVFLAFGMGLRCLGLARVYMAAVGRAPAVWTLLAWIVVLGVTIPFGLVIAPYPNSVQPYQFGLFVLWLFTMAVVWPTNARPSTARWAATALIVTIAAPGTLHYLATAHAARSGQPLLSMGPGDWQIIRYLRRTDPATTLLVQSNPLWPSVYAAESERRVLLAWSSYASADVNPDIAKRSAEIAEFFGSQDLGGAPDVSLLHRFQVTHVIERPATDRLHPEVKARLRLVAGTEDVRLYEVPEEIRRGPSARR